MKRLHEHEAAVIVDGTQLGITPEYSSNVLTIPGHLWGVPDADTCQRCRETPHDDWPATGPGHLCQDCWEGECAEDWHRFVYAWTRLAGVSDE